MAPADRRVPVGRIVGLHGVQGWVKVESWTQPRTQIFAYQPWLLSAPGRKQEITTQEIGAQEIGIQQGVIVQEISGVQGRVQGKGLIATWPGLDNRDLAAVWVGQAIHVARAALPPLPAGDYYWADLEGLEVLTTTGAALGRVSHLFATGANDVVVVRDGVRERLIPFLQGSCVRSVDVSGGRMTVDWDPDF